VEPLYLPHQAQPRGRRGKRSHPVKGDLLFITHEHMTLLFTINRSANDGEAEVMLGGRKFLESPGTTGNKTNK